MNLNNPETRRAMRSVVQSVIAIALVALIAWLIHLLRSSAPDETKIAMALCAIVGLFVAMVGAENVGRVAVDVFGAKADIGEDPPAGGLK